MPSINQSELHKALTSSGDGAALVPYDLDSFLEEELLKQQPLAAIIGVLQAESKTHEYTLRTSHPQGWFEGESTPANNKNSVYTRKSVALKIQRIWGSVTGFAQAVDEAFVNALAEELDGSIEGMSNVLEYGAMWGCADDVSYTGDPYQYSGIVPRLFSYASDNIIDAAGAKVTLDMLDQAIAKATGYRGVRGDPKLWVMGQRMRQIVDGLQTRVQIPLTQVELADGKIRMNAYDGIGILESDYIVPAATSTSPSDMTDTAAAGGAMADGDYAYQIASVTMEGEQVAAAATAGATTETTNNSVDLAWTADANALLYMIFRQVGGTGEFNLIDIIPALTYDAAGTVNGAVETYSDEGALTPNANIEPLAAGEQNILLANVNPRRGITFMGKVDDMGRPLDRIFSFVELARTKDTFDYMLKGYLSLRLKHPNLVSMVRHVKLA